MSDRVFFSITADIFKTLNIPVRAAQLYGDLWSMSRMKGYCFLNVKYLTDRYNKSRASVYRWVNKLEKEGFIYFKDCRNEDYNDWGKRLYVNFDPIKNDFIDKEIRENCLKNETKSLKNETKSIKNETENGIKNDTDCVKNDTESVKNKTKSIKNETTYIKHNNTYSTCTSKKESTYDFQKSFNELIENYTSNIELQNELKEHLKTRKAKKGALTNRAIELSLLKLDELAKTDIQKIMIVQKSIRCGWIDFFESTNYSNGIWRDQVSGILFYYLTTYYSFPIAFSRTIHA